ncbi:hypothetical protein BGZ76_001364 [Entomortierella beljakovae]|nr:hypothetical protein BGZ76_001364 [Entomortierella beljakovae]
MISEEVIEYKEEYIATWIEYQAQHEKYSSFEPPSFETGETGDLARIKEQSILVPQNTATTNSFIYPSQDTQSMPLYPDNVIPYPDNTTPYPDNTTPYPDNIPSYSNITPYSDNTVLYPQPRHPHRRFASLYLPSYGAPIKTVDELAWERHYYYQRLQHEEEELALRNLQDKIYNNANLSAAKQLNQDTITRAVSLNRLASPSQLSKKTSRILGICRSSAMMQETETETEKRIPLHECDDAEIYPIPLASLSPISSPPNGDNQDAVADLTTKKLDHVKHDSYGFVSHQGRDSVLMPGPTPLSRKKTLKDHFTPPFRSIARHYSARFSRSRPNSFAGTRSDPIVDYPPGRQSLGSRFSAYYPHNSDHMSDFKPLKVGPETTEMLRQQQEAHQQTLSSDYGSPTHKDVSLFRSLSTYTPPSTPLFDQSHAIAHAETFPLDNKRRSRRSVHYFESITPQEGDTATSLQNHAYTVVLPPIMTSEIPASEIKERDSLKVQLASIFSFSQKDLLRRFLSLKSKNLTDLPTPPRSTRCLSPLAVEAQDDIMEYEFELEDPPENERDPGEYFSFMLVSKSSRHEYQPLAA